MAPRCSDDLDGPLSCDEHGNNNGVGENWDCYRCDDNSINAGTFCAAGANANETVCQSQCFENATGLPVVPQTACLKQADCGEGRTCKGRCDNTLTCNAMTEGSPLPLVSAAISVCIQLEYKTDVTGTKNIVTGESSIGYTSRSNIQLGTLFTVPCPVCGGVCVGGPDDSHSCFGRCDASNAACLVDGDCVGPGDTACLEAPDDCTGGFCSLDLRCSSGPNEGKLCGLDSVTPLGVMSHDCPPDPANNLSGRGVLQINGGPMTTEAVQMPNAGACTNPTWHNYDCECPADAPGPLVGTPTRPSLCAAACDGGVNAGRSCALGSGGSGTYTTCVGGTDAGFPCDEDSDCEGGSCTSLIKECVGGTALTVGQACTNDGQCGGGTCVEPCPGAHCVPLCNLQGQCNGGSRDGESCATVNDCSVCTGGNPFLSNAPCTRNEHCDTGHNTGDGVCSVQMGVTCDPNDSEEGLCAVGPQKYRCTGEGFTTLPCSLDRGNCQANVCTSGSPSRQGQACVDSIDCIENGVPIAEGCEAGDDGVLGNGDDHPGAGDCRPRPEDCYVNNGFAEGGDTLNGNGSPSDVKLVGTFCTPPLGNPAIDDVSGFGGPSRLRRFGSAFMNVTATP